MREKILFLATHFISLYATRRELIKKLADQGYEIYISIPESKDNKFFEELGCKIVPTKVERRGTNPIIDFFLILRYRRIIRTIKPDIILSYEIKPNIYGGMAKRGFLIPQIANITGLGTAIENGGLLGQFVLLLYKIGLKKSEKVFFQNQSNLKLFLNKGIVTSNYELLPGSGVNLEEHCFEPYPAPSDDTVFLIIGRIMRNKGTNEIIEAAQIIHSRHENVTFRLIGFYDDEKYKRKIEQASLDGIIDYCGNQVDVHTYIKNSHATIHASYHEGMANGLLETAATGRPVIATNIPGCIETFEPNISGIAFQAKDSNDLVRAIEEFLALSYEEKARMGQAGRERMEKQFDRNIVINKYLKEVKKIESKGKKDVSVAVQQAN